MHTKKVDEKEFKSMPNCTGAFRYMGHYYCFHGHQFSKFDPMTGEVHGKYPKEARDYFMRCPHFGKCIKERVWKNGRAGASILALQNIFLYINLSCLPQEVRPLRTMLRENSAVVYTWMLLHLMTLATYMLSEVSFIIVWPTKSHGCL